jgi:hypothetical protein
MTRRQFGRVRQLQSKRWRALYPGPDGHLRAAPRTFATEQGAERFLASVAGDMASGDWFDPRAG